jgi:hypothetical protein
MVALHSRSSLLKMSSHPVQKFKKSIYKNNTSIKSI